MEIIFLPCLDQLIQVDAYRQGAQTREDRVHGTWVPFGTFKRVNDWPNSLS